MMKSYRNFNLTCAILSAFFLLGTILIYVRTTNGYEITCPTCIDGPPASTAKRVGRGSRGGLANYEIKIEIAGPLPVKINLNVPFTSQAPEKDWGQPWQDACEEAALLMLDAYYKKYNLSPLFARDEIIKMVEWEEKQGWGRSIEIEKVRLTLEHFSTIALKHIRIVENPAVEQIKAFVASGNPVLVLADGKVLPNPHFRNGGPVYHSLIIRGYDDDEFITNDPGTQFGKNFKYKYDDLMNAIHEWNGGDVKNGRKVILVIE